MNRKQESLSYAIIKKLSLQPCICNPQWQKIRFYDFMPKSV